MCKPSCLTFKDSFKTVYFQQYNSLLLVRQAKRVRQIRNPHLDHFLLKLPRVILQCLCSRAVDHPSLDSLMGNLGLTQGGHTERQDDQGWKGEKSYSPSWPIIVKEMMKSEDRFINYKPWYEHNQPKVLEIHDFIFIASGEVFSETWWLHLLQFRKKLLLVICEGVFLLTIIFIHFKR